MNECRAKSKRFLWPIAVVAACLAAAAGIRHFLSPRGGRSDGALTDREISRVDGWRLLDRVPTDGATMTSARFEAVVDKPAPVLKSFRIENTSNKPIGGFWIYREGAPNFRNALTIVESVTAGRETDGEKAAALFALFPKFYENFYPASDGGLLYEPSVLLAVFGWGQCNIASHNLETLCQLAGFETRGVGLETPGTNFAHKTMEVFYEGAWHYFDPDGRVFFTRDDGRIASVADLQAAPDLIRRGPEPVGYDRETYAAAFERGKVEVFEYPEKFRMAQRHRDPAHYPHYRHVMRYDLLPRTTFRLERGNRGLFYSERKDMGPPPSYANGVIRTTVRGAEAAVWGEFIVDGALILPVVSPYILVGGRIEGTTEKSLRVAWLPFNKDPMYRAVWTDLGTVRGRFSLDFSPCFHEYPIFGYALKLTPAPSEIGASVIEVVTDFQHNPKAFPQLKQGPNAFYLYTSDARQFTPLPGGGGLEVETPDGLRVVFEVEPGEKRELKSEN